MKSALLAASLAVAIIFAALPAQASSHREAPFITGMPKVDGTDYYMFNSYEAGREGFVTILANYLPLQSPGNGPNYYAFDEDALYEIHIDNNGDAAEDITFQFRFDNEFKDIALPIGDEMVPIPLIQAGPVGPTAADTALLNRVETYEIDVVRGDRRSGESQAVTNADDSAEVFAKPVDNIGNKTIADYAAYASDHIYNVAVPDCSAGGKVFVGQRKEGFFITVGKIFDLLNLDPLGAPDAFPNALDGLNITTIALELPVDCLVTGDDPVIGGWTTASKRQATVLNPSPPDAISATVEGGAFTQVSRIGMPLVNELVIGLPAKNNFNHSEPAEDAQFLTYVTNPTLPALIETLFPAAVAPTMFPRDDLVAAFLTGVPMLNQPATVTPAEMMRLNTSIAAVPAAAQDPLGVLADDLAGYPNGRRPGDDVVDISLRVAMGVLIEDPAVAPAGQMPFTDQTRLNATDFDEAFPYLLTPLPGATN
ncbi:MAG: DUF4331 domain-containing protein [Gammaproteobacteria bacterium]|nr:DUF4331 domain-containing protein [Gammaproteobacteria bacterium]